MFKLIKHHSMHNRTFAFLSMEVVIFLWHITTKVTMFNSRLNLQSVHKALELTYAGANRMHRFLQAVEASLVLRHFLYSNDDNYFILYDNENRWLLSPRVSITCALFHSA